MAIPSASRSAGSRADSLSLARPARHRNGTGGLHLRPDPPPDLVGFGDDAGLVHREHLAVAHDELAVDHDRLDVGRLTVVDPRGHDAPRRHEVGAQRVERRGGLPSSRPRASRRALPAARLAHRLAWRLRACLPAAAGRRGTRSSRRMRSVSSAIRITSNRSLVLLSVPFAIGQPAARSAGIGGMTPRFAAIAAWCDTMVPRLGQQRDIAIVHVPAVRREQPRAEEAVLGEKRRRTNAVVLHHEIDFGAALRQVNRVSEIVFLGEGADRLQQLGRRRSRRARRPGTR